MMYRFDGYDKLGNPNAIIETSPQDEEEWKAMGPYPSLRDAVRLLSKAAARQFGIPVEVIEAPCPRRQITTDADQHLAYSARFGDSA